MSRFKYYTPIIMQKIGYVVFFPLYKFFTNIKITGTENLKCLNGPIIFASNHTSELDATAIPLVLPFFSSFSPIYFVTNKIEKYKTFGWRSYVYGGTFFNMLGGYAIHSGYKSYAISLDNHIKLLRRGRTICIFPEGKRTRDGIMNPARGGLGYLVYLTGASVVPLAIDTFFNISFWDFLMRRRKVVITILPAMTPSQLINTKNPGVEDFRSAGQMVLNKIKEVLN